MSFRFQFRRGTTAERDASNPILAAGEPAVVLDSGQPAELVLGDGVTAMADLRAAVWDDDARLALAGTATQPGDLGTAAAADTTDFATAAQGAATYMVVPVASGATAADFQAAADVGLTAGRPIRIAPAPGTYTVRNLRLQANTWLDLAGVTLQYGGSGGRTPLLENVPVVVYAEGESGALLKGVRITGGTMRGLRTGTDFSINIGPDQQDLCQLEWTDGAVVEGVTFVDGNQDALCIANSVGAHVSRCRFVDIADGGVELRSGSNYEVSECRFETVGNGIQSKPNVTDVRIHANWFQTFREGLLFHGSRWRITNNTVLSTTAGGIDGAAWKGITYADVWSGAFTMLDGSDITIAGNTIDGRTNNAAVSALYLSGGHILTDVKITGNTITNCRHGVEMAVGSRVLISDNQIASASQGVWLSATTDMTATISRNQISSTGVTSPRCMEVSAPRTTIAGNNLTAVDATVTLASTATDCSITGNQMTVTGTVAAIALTGARCRATDNTIYTTASAGVTVQGENCLVSGNIIKPTGGESVVVGASGSDTAGLRSVIANNRMIGGTHGVRVYADNASVAGNSVSGAQFFGVNVAAGALAAFLTGNYLTGNGSGAVNDAGTGTTLANNITT